MSKTLPETVSKIYALLEPFESEDRQRIVSSAMTLLGEKEVTRSPARLEDEHGEENGDGILGTKAKRWMKQNGLTYEALEEVFHFEGDDVEVIASEIPGGGKREQSKHCYLLCGIRSLLKTDEPRFTDSEAVDLCKRMGCHDSANHYKTRKALGKNVAGLKSTGFTLPAPGLKAAAALVLEMAKPS